MPTGGSGVTKTPLFSSFSFSHKSYGSHETRCEYEGADGIVFNEVWPELHLPLSKHLGPTAVTPPRASVENWRESRSQESARLVRLTTTVPNFLYRVYLYHPIAHTFAIAAVGRAVTQRDREICKRQRLCLCHRVNMMSS